MHFKFSTLKGLIFLYFKQDFKNHQIDNKQSSRLILDYLNA